LFFALEIANSCRNQHDARALDVGLFARAMRARFQDE